MPGHKYQKGHKKFEGSGMQKGMKRKATSAREAMEAAGCDPIEGMIRIAQDEANKPELRGKMFAELAQYIWPKLKAIEHKGLGGESNGQATIDEMRQKLIDAVAELPDDVRFIIAKRLMVAEEEKVIDGIRG